MCDPVKDRQLKLTSNKLANTVTISTIVCSPEDIEELRKFADEIGIPDMPVEYYEE